MSIREQLQSLGIPIPDDIAGHLEQWASSLKESPGRNTLAVVGLSTLLFYLSERGRNPKVKDIYDALVYCTTCMSVGYADIFARTPLGKVVGSALMTFGPPLTAKCLDGRHTPPPPDPTQQEILDTLRRILAKLESEPR